MAWFQCPTCGHQQQAADAKIGKAVVCPKCKSSGTVTAEKRYDAIPQTEPSDSSTPPLSTLGLMRNHSHSTFVGTVAIILLAISVVLQSLILIRLNRTIPVQLDGDSIAFDIGSSPLPVEVQNSHLAVEVGNSSIPVDVQNPSLSVDFDGQTLPVEVQNSELAVEVANFSFGVTLPVRVQNKQLDVNLANHEIQFFDALPVKVTE